MSLSYNRFRFVQNADTEGEVLVCSKMRFRYALQKHVVVEAEWGIKGVI